MDWSKLNYNPGFHRDRPVIWIEFKYDTAIAKEVKNLTSAKWSATKKSWYVDDRPDFRSLFGLHHKPVNPVQNPSIDEVNKPALTQYVEQLKLKAYSPNTIRTYSGFGLCVWAGFGAQNCLPVRNEVKAGLPALNLNRSTKLQVCTTPRLMQNPCWRLALYIYSNLLF